MLLLDEHSPRIPAAKRRLMVWPLQPRSSTEAFCLKSSHVHICSTPVFKRALLSSEHVRWTLTPLRACPALPYPTLAARGQDKRTPTYPTHKPDPLTTYPPTWEGAGTLALRCTLLPTARFYDRRG